MATAMENLLDAPPEERRSIMTSFESLAVRTGGPAMPFWDNVKPEHIPELIKSMDRDAKLNFDDRQRNRVLALALVAVVIGMVVFLVYTLAPSNPELVERLVTGFGALVVGLGGGYGLGTRSRD